MTIEQIYEKLNEERINPALFSCRFPFRIIMVKNIVRYCELLKLLKQLTDVSVISFNELSSGSDIMLRYENLKKDSYASKWVILTGVSEYLRLFAKDEAKTQRLKKLLIHRVSANSTGRIIIPLWGCEALWYDSTLRLTTDERLDDYYFDCVDENDKEQNLTVTVLSAQFRQYKNQLTTSHNRIFDNLQEWYEFWANPATDIAEYMLITARSHLIHPTNGAISVHIVQDTLSFIQGNLIDGQMLTAGNCPETIQDILFNAALQNKKLDKAILSCLNVGSFSALDIMGKWNTLKIGEKELVRLWYRLHPDNSYLCHCILKTSDITLLEDLLLHDIFRIQNIPQKWLSESQELIKVMKLERDKEYFDSLDKLPEYSERLNYLSGMTSQERIYILKIVGNWLRVDKNAVFQYEQLKYIYPELCDYLCNEGYNDELGQYMELYKTFKLSNTLPDNEDLYISSFQTDNYDFRYTVLDESLNKQTIMLWIDALGIEWMPLLLRALNQCTAGKIIKNGVGQTNLPTETKYNMQWQQMNVPYEKLDYLDKLAHKGLSYKDIDDYYSCVEEQIAFITKTIVSKVTELLKQYHRVIVTGDHGTSRLAARYFHVRDAVPTPKNITIGSHGRYGIVSRELKTKLPLQTIVKDSSGNQYVVFRNYDHYSRSGFAAGADDDNAIYGEIHGGASPEEMLVPIIVFDSTNKVLLTAEWENNTVKISRKKVKATVKFNQPVGTLQARIGNISAITTMVHDNKIWTLEFAGLKANNYDVLIIANGKTVSIECLTVKSALGNGDDDIW